MISAVTPAIQAAGRLVSLGEATVDLPVTDRAFRPVRDTGCNCQTSPGLSLCLTSRASAVHTVSFIFLPNPLWCSLVATQCENTCKYYKAEIYCCSLPRKRGPHTARLPPCSWLGAPAQGSRKLLKHRYSPSVLKASWARSRPVMPLVSSIATD